MSVQPSTEFKRIDNLPSYVFSVIDDLKAEILAKGHEIIDFGMGNPDQPTPNHIVETLVQTAKVGANHRYSISHGIDRVREAIASWYQKRFSVTLNPETEAIFTIGSKEGLADLTLATLSQGDRVITPDPAYPIHPYGPIIAGAEVIYINANPGSNFEEELFEAMKTQQPKMVFLNFPSNPTSECVDLSFFERVVAVAKAYGIWVVHDLAYADLAYDGYESPSIMQVEGAKEIAVEVFTLSKSYNMAGWRAGFMVGNPILIKALKKIKSYLDYGMFAPIQEAAITALTGPQDCVEENRERYCHRRNLLCDGLNKIGWEVEKPKASMFLWAKIPKMYRPMGSMAFFQKLMKEAGVAVAPGIGFGKNGDDYVRFGFIVEDDKVFQALENIQKMFVKDGFYKENEKLKVAMA